LDGVDPQVSPAPWSGPPLPLGSQYLASLLSNQKESVEEASVLKDFQTEYLPAQVKKSAQILEKPGGE